MAYCTGQAIFMYRREAENSVTGKAYMGEMLMQVWLTSIKK